MKMLSQPPRRGEGKCGKNQHKHELERSISGTHCTDFTFVQVLPELHLENSASRTGILLHNNLLSCDVSSCGNVTTRTSIIAIGNRLRHPKGAFPAWISKHEHDPFFWVSGVEVTCLLLKISGTVIAFMLVMAWKINTAKWLRAMSTWQVGPAPDLWVMQASSHIHCCLAKEFLFAVVFLMFLLHWDLYACPETFALASACLRSSVLVRASVFLCWWMLSFHSQAVEHLIIDGKDQKQQWTAKTFRKRLLLCLLWCILTMLCSTAAIFYQVIQSIPGTLPVSKILSLGLTACIGTIQGVVGKLIIPLLARKLTWAEACLCDSFQFDHELLDSCCHHHVPGHRMGIG